MVSSTPLVFRVCGDHSNLSPKAVAPTPNRVPHFGPPDRPQLDLDHFVCASIVVRQMCQLYDQCSGYGAAPISRDDFIRAVISLP